MNWLAAMSNHGARYSGLFLCTPTRTAKAAELLITPSTASFGAHQGSPGTDRKEKPGIAARPVRTYRTVRRFQVATLLITCRPLEKPGVCWLSPVGCLAASLC